MEERWNFFHQNGGRSLLPEEESLNPSLPIFSLLPLPKTYMKFWNKIKEAFFRNCYLPLFRTLPKEEGVAKRKTLGVCLAHHGIAKSRNRIAIPTK
jgi:hypothetical protein